VQINEFKGKQLVDIREFYEKDEQMLPGKKVVLASPLLDVSEKANPSFRESLSISSSSLPSSSSCPRSRKL
jgi:hypothetical protein